MLGKPRQSWILDFGSHAVDSNPGIGFCQWNWDSGFQMEKFRGFRNPHFLTCGETSINPPSSPAPSHQVKTDHYPFLGNCPPTPLP